jgi:HSP20 family protein
VSPEFKTEFQETKEKDYYFSERRYGSFVRTLPLPQAVDVGKIKATFANGVLKVNMPKLPEAKTKSKTHKIAIGHYPACTSAGSPD